MPRKTKNRTKRHLRKTKKTRRNKHRQKKYYMVGCNNKKCRFRKMFRIIINYQKI